MAHTYDIQAFEKTTVKIQGCYQKILDRIHTLFAESKLPVTVDVQAYELIKYPPLKKHIDEAVKILFTKEDLTQKAL